MNAVTAIIKAVLVILLIKLKKDGLYQPQSLSLKPEKRQIFIINAPISRLRLSMM
jgi:hypothetical protein